MVNFNPDNILNITLTKLLKTDFTEFENASEAFEFICTSVNKAIGVGRVSIWDISDDKMTCKYIYPTGSAPKPGTVLTESEQSTYFKAIKKGLPIIANDALKNENTREFKDIYLIPLKISSMLDVPIHERGQQTGVLCCEHIGDKRTWLETEVYFVSLVAGLVSLVNSLLRVAETERALREERLLLETIVDNLPFNVFVKNQEHKWILSNKATLNYAGVTSAAELLGKKSDQIFPDNEHNIFTEQDEFVLKTGEAIIKRESFHVRPGDHSLRKFLVSKYPLRNDKNEVSGVIGIGEDITERAYFEQHLKEREEQFRFIAENTSDGIIVLKQGNLSYHSPAYEKISGYSKEELSELTHSDFRDLLHPEDRDKISELYAKAVGQMDESFRVEQRVLSKSGEYRWRENTINLIYDKDGKVDSVVTVVRDISESKESEIKLEDSESLLSEILHSLTEAVWAIDLRTNTPAFVSKSFESLFGFSLEEWRENPKKWTDVIHEDDRHHIEKVLDDVKSKFFGAYTVRVFNKEGKVRWVENRGNILFDDNGEPKMLLGMAVDISEKVENLKKIEESERRLSVILNSLDEIVWAVKLPSREPLYINNSFEEVFGISSEKWYEDYAIWFDFVTNGSKEKAEGMLKELFNQGHSHGVLQIEDANNNLKWINCVGKYVYDENNELDMMLGITLDITDQVNTQNQLKASERNLSNILNALDEAVWAASLPEYNPLFVSKSFEEFYGFNIEEWQANWFLWEDAVHPEDKHLIQNFKEKVNNFETVSVTCRIISLIGENERWVHNIAKTVKDENGEPYMLLGIAIDVTEKKAREEQLDKAKNQALKAEMAKAELELKTLQMQMNPHFIFNSLNSIQSFILKNDVISTNDYLTKFARLIRSFLDSSRSVTIRLREEIKLLQLYVEMEQMRFEDKFDFKIHVGPSVDKLMEVPSMMLQPFVENAINHGIRYKGKKGLLEITFKVDGNRLLCIIEDDGVGMKRAKEILERTNQGYISQGLKITAERFMTYNAINQTHISYDISDLTNEPGIKEVGTSVRVFFPITKT